MIQEFGLIPLKVATWGPFVLLNFEKDVSPDQEVESDTAAKEWTGSCVDILANNCIDPSLTYLCRREYTLECNWKVSILGSGLYSVIFYCCFLLRLSNASTEIILSAFKVI